MRVLITGATGLIGKEIVKLCFENGIAVNYLSTNKVKIKQTESCMGFYWNPKAQDIDANCFINVDTIIHLAGATISKRWTPEYKKEILSSRNTSTALLINALKGESISIKHVISASAIGIYRDSLSNYYDESYKENGGSFLNQVVKEWEESVDGFSKLHIDVCKIRIGLVLSNNGGALQEMIKPIKFGLGSAFGSSRQWQSWIHINDLVSLFLYALNHRLIGVYNGVAPNPVTNRELINAIAKVLHRPIILPNIPRFIMKLLLGEMHTLLYESQRVSSKKIERKGFYFRYNNLRPALENLLKK